MPHWRSWNSSWEHQLLIVFVTLLTGIHQYGFWYVQKEIQSISPQVQCLRSVQKKMTKSSCFTSTTPFVRPGFSWPRTSPPSNGNVVSEIHNCKTHVFWQRSQAKFVNIAVRKYINTFKHVFYWYGVLQQIIFSTVLQY